MFFSNTNYYQQNKFTYFYLIIKTSPLRLLSVEIFSNDVYVVVPKPAIEMSIISKDIDCIMSSIKKQKFN